MRAWLLVAMGWMPVGGETPDLTRVLQGVEDHYNRSQAIEVHFTETYTQRGRKRSESGVLYLRKPGKMRWQYTMPEGKLFVSDGEFVYYYSPEDHRAEKAKLKQTDDMRAPLAFLLGRINFHEDYREFRSTVQGQDLQITALPKSDKFPYSEVSFLAGADSVIRHLTVKMQDNSVLEFTFDGEKRNPPIPDAMFHFTPPPGAEYVDSSK